MTSVTKSFRNGAINPTGKLQAVSADLQRATGDQGLLSFADGVKNIVGVREINQNIALSIVNNTSKARIVYIAPSELLGGIPLSKFMDNSYPGQNLPAGHSFADGTFEDPDKVGEQLTIEPLNDGQFPEILAANFTKEPTQFTHLSMFSKTVDGVPEASNYTNTMTHYKLSPYKEPDRSTPMRLNKYLSSKDNSTEILNVDLLKNFPKAIVSSHDVFSIRINAGTKLDITLTNGARFSESELFYRQAVKGGSVVAQHFPEGSSCGC